MKKDKMIKIVLAATIFGSLFTAHIISAEENNGDKLHASEEAVNEAFIKQFPYAEQFIDTDGVPARRIKAPDVEERFWKKGKTREKIRRINYKNTTGKTLFRIYQTITYYGTYEYELPKEAPVNELPEYHEAKGEPLVQPELPEYHEAKGEPLVQPELPEYHEAKGEPLVQPELPEYHEAKGEPLVQPKLPEYKEEQTKDIPPVVAVPKKEEPKEVEKPRVSEEPKEETSKDKPKEPTTTIPETTITEEKKVPQLPQTGESFDGGILGLALASLATAIFILKTTLKEKVK